MPRKIDNLLVWASEVDQNTLDQAAKASRLPFVDGHVALMPDAHVGIGATVGSVIPTSGAIIPSAIGVDIGCGMIAVETRLNASQLPDDLGKLLLDIESAIPSGVGRGHAFKTDWDRERHTRRVPPYSGSTKLTGKQVTKITDQFGTLGSGNHFVEVCLDETDQVWLVLHSGSRGIGNQLATRHMEVAKGLMRDMSVVLEDPALAYILEGTPEFDAYIRDMLWAQEYARSNRDAMMDAFLAKFRAHVGVHGSVEKRRINCHHNYTEKEHHGGRSVWLTRKGAIRAAAGDMGVIPGSMGTSSYIVRGLGNEDSYSSASHGAGRRLSRGQARRELTASSLKEAMAGVAWNHRDASKLVDEHPQSYKDIDQVMADQRDLVAVEHTLHQVLNYKGV